jgi:hypothetical protein
MQTVEIGAYLGDVGGLLEFLLKTGLADQQGASSRKGK